MRDSRGDKARILHIMEAVSLIEEYTGNVDFAGFKSNRMMKDAVEKQLAVIGEASDHLSGKLKDKYSSVEWFKIKGLRNRIIHQYFDIDINIVWDIINKDLVELKMLVSEILDNELKDT